MVADVPLVDLQLSVFLRAVQEQQQHRAAVAELLFAPSGDRLFSGGMDGALVVYDVQRMYAPTQFLSAGVRDIKVRGHPSMATPPRPQDGGPPPLAW